MTLYERYTLLVLASPHCVHQLRAGSAHCQKFKYLKLTGSFPEDCELCGCILSKMGEAGRAGGGGGGNKV